jgi:ribosomal protein L6P/L9E
MDNLIVGVTKGYKYKMRYEYAASGARIWEMRFADGHANHR